MEAIDEANEGDILINVFQDAGENASAWGGLPVSYTHLDVYKRQ